MYSTKFLSLQRFWVFAVIIILVSGCASTINYKNIQDDFNKAVESDNIQSYDPQMLGTLTTTYQNNYEDVIQRLNEPYIQSLDPRLKMNAYTMKAISQWRTGKLDDAKLTLSQVQDQPDVTVGERDKLVLLILPALITDQELTQKYRRLPVYAKNPLLFRNLSYKDYKTDFEKGYSQAVSHLKEAIKQTPPGLPENMINYIHYQRWRILKNWGMVIASMPEPESRESALKDAKGLLGASLKDEIEKEMVSVPEGNQLRNLMKEFTLIKPGEQTLPKPGESKPAERKPLL